MTNITLEKLKDKLSDRNLTVLSNRIGLSYGTLRSIARGENKNPTIQNLEKIARYFKENR